MASKELVAARKWNCLGCGVPRSVTALSKLTIVRSASESSGTIGPNACGGSASSVAVRSVKWTSPAKASVMSPAGGGTGADAGTEEARLGAADGMAAGGAVPQAASAARVSAAGSNRPRGRINTSPRYGSAAVEGLLRAGMQRYRIGQRGPFPADRGRRGMYLGQLLLVVEKQLRELVRQVLGHVRGYHDQVGVGQRRDIGRQRVHILRDRRLGQQVRVRLLDLRQQVLGPDELHRAAGLGEQVDDAGRGQAARPDHRVDAAVQDGRCGLRQRHRPGGDVLVRVDVRGAQQPPAEQVAAGVGAAQRDLVALHAGDAGDARVDPGDHVLVVVVRAGQRPERLRPAGPGAGPGVPVVGGRGQGQRDVHVAGRQALKVVDGPAGRGGGRVVPGQVLVDQVRVPGAELVEHAGRVARTDDQLAGVPQRCRRVPRRRAPLQRCGPERGQEGPAPHSWPATRAPGSSALDTRWASSAVSYPIWPRSQPAAPRTASWARSPTAITSSTPPSMSTTVWRTRPVARHLAAPTVRLASPLVIAESWSDRSTGRPSEDARGSPSTEAASASATPGTRRANEVSSQLRLLSASFVGSVEILIPLLRYVRGPRCSCYAGPRLPGRWPDRRAGHGPCPGRADGCRPRPRPGRRRRTAAGRRAGAGAGRDRWPPWARAARRSARRAAGAPAGPGAAPAQRRRPAPGPA